MKGIGAKTIGQIKIFDPLSLLIRFLRHRESIIVIDAIFDRIKMKKKLRK